MVIEDPALKRWWQRHEHRTKGEQQKRADPVLSRLSQMAAHPELRYIFGQSKSSFQIRDVLLQNKILLVNLKGVSKDTASLAGTIITNIIWNQGKSLEKDLPTYIILDEFGSFADLAVDTQTMLDQSRKHKLGLILANQRMSQLTPNLASAVTESTRSKVIMQTGTDDAKSLGSELHGDVKPEDITNLPAYEAIASVLTPVGSSGPISITTSAPDPPTGFAPEIIERGRKLYGTPVADVQREIEQRYNIAPPKHRSKISGEGLL